MVSISEKIASLRKAHNLTQEALGEAVGVTPQAVSKWEKGDSLPDISIIPDICRLFGISADTLLGNEGNITAEMYAKKALETCKSPEERLRLTRFMMSNGKNSGEIPEKKMKTLGAMIHEASIFSIDDSRGFGMFFDDIEYVKDMMSVDLTKSALLRLMADEKILKIFTLICINGRLNESELIKLTGFTQKELTERLFTLIKCTVINSVIDEYGENRENAYAVSDAGILLLGIMANVFLYDPESRKGLDGSGGGYACNPQKLRRYINRII